MNLADLLDNLRNHVRNAMEKLASSLDRTSNGRLQPDIITYLGFAMHIPIALLIATQQFYVAAVLLVVFGLFDALDGALARVQHKASAAGMLLDASTDRIKEVLLYIGAAYALIELGEPIGAVWAVAAAGASLSVSYVKAKGEAAVTSSGLSPSQVNRLFADGLMRFEIRMAFVVIGLLSGQLFVALVAITVLSTYTAFYRLFRIKKRLQTDDHGLQS